MQERGRLCYIMGDVLKGCGVLQERLNDRRISRKGLYKMKDRDRVQYYDCLNVLACFAVVVLHVNGGFWSFSEDGRWVESLLIESFFYPAVAIFFMLTGATLLDYRRRCTTAEYARKRLLRVGVPYVAWSLLAIGFHVLKGQLTVEQITPINVLGWLINGDYYNVYWFFAPLFACYLAIPVLSAVNVKNRDRIYGYAFCLAFVTISLMPMAARWLGFKWNAELQTPVSAGYMMYVLLGYLLARHELPKPARLGVYALAVGAFALRTGMTYTLSCQAGMVDYAYGGYVNFPCVLQAAAVFVAFRQRRPMRSQRAAGAVRWLAGASFTVYLAHKFIIDLLVRFALVPDWLSRSAAYPLVLPIVVYGLAVGVYAAGRRIPGIRRVFFPA